MVARDIVPNELFRHLLTYYLRLTITGGPTQEERGRRWTYGHRRSQKEVEVVVLCLAFFQPNENVNCEGLHGGEQFPFVQLQMLHGRQLRKTYRDTFNVPLYIRVHIPAVRSPRTVSGSHGYRG